ncbi:hypothetical protein AVEN_231217-1 [Araneus ventricosus]|uniref:Uncharacterized protein n=1 Tax=Araneus ventricosus TaxID=182803 RepID=A0A4Y2TYX2_ARAVE|nr:hypothetical protein AVEN_231217-1 [Araneus ventricosus]
MMLRHPIPEEHSPVLSAVTCLTAKASGEEGPEPRNTLFVIARACKSFYLVIIWVKHKNIMKNYKIMVYSSCFLQPTLSPKQAHFYEWPKGVMSVFRRPDLRSQRPKSIFSPPRKSSPCSFLSSSKNSLLLHPRSSLFNPHLLPTGERSKASSRILVNSVGGVHLSEPLLVPYLLVLLLSQAGSQAGDK